MANPSSSNSPSPPFRGGASDGKELVRQAVDLVRLIGESVQLKRAGRRYSGLCPFHSEKSPSFSVDPERGLYHCFGCKKSGDAFSFVMERDRVDFKTALQTLAEWAGVELPKFSGPSREQTDHMQRLRDCMSAAADIYRKVLRSDEGKAARDYMTGRGFDAKTLDSFGVGFAPDGWDSLARLGLAKKFSEEELLDAGLIKRGDRGGMYDVFRSRLVFPIRDEQGRPIAFGGRILPGDDSPAKYLNSPETPLFSKSRVLFGVDLAKGAMVKSRTAIIFEGYADAAMAHQHGIDNAVAVLGTALTPEHAAVLRRLADKVVLVFDADAAGGMATRRSVELFLREPIEVSVAELPAGMDPDEFLQAHGADAFRQRIDKAVDALAYQWRALTRQLDGGVTARQKATETYLNLIAEARSGVGGAIDPMRWSAVLSRVSRLTGLAVDDLQKRFEPRRHGAAQPFKAEKRPWLSKEEWNRRKQYDGPRRSDLPSTGPVPDGHQQATRDLLGALFNKPALWESVQPHCSPEEFGGAQERWLGDLFWSHLRNEGEPLFTEWLEVVEGALLSAGRSVESVGRAKEACIQFADDAAAKGEAADVAAAALSDFSRMRERRELDELLSASRRIGGEAHFPETGEAGIDVDADPTRQLSGHEAERDMLRNMEKRLGMSGRIKPPADN